MVSERAVLRGHPARFMNTNRITKTTRAYVLETLVPPERNEAFIIGGLDGLERVPLGFEKAIQTAGIHFEMPPLLLGA